MKSSIFIALAAASSHTNALIVPHIFTHHRPPSIPGIDFTDDSGKRAAAAAAPVWLFGREDINGYACYSNVPLYSLGITYCLLVSLLPRQGRQLGRKWHQSRNQSSTRSIGFQSRRQLQRPGTRQWEILAGGFVSKLRYCCLVW